MNAGTAGGKGSTPNPRQLARVQEDAVCVYACRHAGRQAWPGCGVDNMAQQVAPAACVRV